MSSEHRTDRRQSYSFTHHFQRALATKGVRRVLAPMLATAVIAGVSFANCSSDGITGPDSGSRQSPAGPISATTSGGLPGGGGTEVTPFPVTEEEIPTELAGVEVPTTMQATACNGDVVAWEDARTRGGGVSYLNTKTGAMRVKIKITQHAKGVGTRSQTDPKFPKRYYVGWEEYEKELYMALGVSEAEEEFDLHIIAKGENETRQFQDDYMLRLRVWVAIRNGQMSMRSSTYEKCF